jgi:hypothetical protein
MGACLRAMLVSFCNKGLFSTHLSCPVHWMGLLDSILEAQLAAGGVTGKEGAGGVATRRPFRAPILSWREYGEAARKLGFGGPDDPNLRRATEFLDVLVGGTQGDWGGGGGGG